MIGRQEIFEHVAGLLDSEQFITSPSVAKLLTFCVDAALAGNEESLKETMIGIFCFGRAPGYDTKQDPIVRVTARRLRKKLELFYQNEGENHKLRIVFPKGTYVPRFNRWSSQLIGTESSSSEELMSLNTAPAADADPIVPQQIPAGMQFALAAQSNWLKPATWSLLIFLFIVSGALFLARPHPPQDDKATASQLHLSQPRSLTADSSRVESGIPSIEKQIQMKRQILSELSSLVPAKGTESHEKFHEHPSADSANDIVASVEPRL